MTEYNERMIAHCAKQLQKAQSERNPVLIAYYGARIEELSSNHCPRGA
jgi:hypothetical protein